MSSFTILTADRLPEAGYRKRGGGGLVPGAEVAHDKGVTDHSGVGSRFESVLPRRTDVSGEDGERSARIGPLPATEAAVLFVALGVLATALLPSAASFRAGVVLSAVFLLAFGGLWFRAIPRRFLGESRFTAGASITVAIAGLLLVLTGGLHSPYFGVYLLSILGSVFAVRPGAAAITGAGAMIGYILIGAEELIFAGPGRGTVDVAVIGVVTLAGATLFAWALTRSLRRSSDALVRRAEVLADAAITDPLTGLRNRAVIDEHLGLMQANAERLARPYALIALDVDNLKRINDRLGHEAGDAALLAVASAVRSTLRGADVGVRTGGDEFLVLLPETRLEDALVVAERLRAALRDGQSAETRSRVTTSAGVAGWRHGRDGAVVRRAADAMLYAAKSAGRDRVVAEPREEPSSPTA